MTHVDTLEAIRRGSPGTYRLSPDAITASELKKFQPAAEEAIRLAAAGGYFCLPHSAADHGRGYDLVVVEIPRS